MILEPYSFNGTSLQSTDYDSFIPNASAQLQMRTSAIYTRRAGAVPVLAGKDFNPHTLTLSIEMQHSFMTLFESLNQLFDTKDETPRQLICIDTEDSNKQYYIYATATDVLGGHDGPMATIVLATDDPIWKSVTENSQAVTISAATTTTDVTAAGNDNSYPTFEISATSSPTTDYPYARPIQVLPRSSYFWNDRYLDLCGTTDGTTLDTAALVAAGKMQADGDDLRVFRDGVEIDRWLNGINTTDTHVIIAENMPRAYNLTLAAAIASTDTVTSISITYNNANLLASKYMPYIGRLIIDSSLGSTDTEEFAYTAKNVSGTSFTFTVNSRALRGTVATNHAVGDNVRFLPYDYMLTYGNATVSAPEVDSTQQPIEDLTSRNNSLTYSNFAGLATPRRGSWAKGIRRVGDSVRSRSDFYTSTNDEGDTDPATVMGLEVSTYEANGIWNADTVLLNWIKTFPDGVESISANGTQYQNSVSFPNFSLRGEDITSTYINELFAISAQSATDYSTWTTWTKATTDITVPSNTTKLIWQAQGTVLGTTDYTAKVDIDSMTVGLLNPPHVMLRDESTDSRIDLTISNTTTGESLRVIYQASLNDTLVIDTDPDFPNAKYKGQLVNGAVSLSSIRSAWLKLQPGSNTLTFTNNLSVTNNLTVTVKWRDRMNFF